MNQRVLSILAAAVLAVSAAAAPTTAYAQECPADAAVDHRGLAAVAGAIDGAVATSPAAAEQVSASRAHAAWWSHALHVTDDVMGVAALGVGVGALVIGGSPVIAIAGASIGVYFAARGAYDLYQRWTTHQSLDPLHDAQARGDYLGIVAGAFGAGALASGARVIGGLQAAKLLGVSGMVAGLATMPDATIGLVRSWGRIGTGRRGMAIAQLGLVAVSLGHDGVADRALLAEENAALHATASDPVVAHANRLFGHLPSDVDAVDQHSPETPPATVRAFLGPDAKFLGQGWTAKAWGNQDWVVKVTKKTTDVWDGRVMPTEDPAKRQAMAVSSVQVMNALRSSPDFAPWAHLLPDTFSPGPYVVVQRRATGLSYGALSDAAKVHADGELELLRAAAERAVPGYEWDLNHGNETFDADGNVVSWFDPAGGASWMPVWKPGMPIARNTWNAASALIHGRIDGTTFQPSSEKFALGDTYAKKITGPDLQFGDGYVVANLELNRAFVVKNGFRYAYDGAQWLGAPTDEEHWEGSVVSQHFQHGSMTWSPEQGVHVHAAE